MSRTDGLAGELKRVIRQAPKDPDVLAGTLEILGAFHGVTSANVVDDSDVVQFVVQNLLPEYLDRLPENDDCLAIRDLFDWEDGDGNARSLQARYEDALEHVTGVASDFGRRQEPRLLKLCAFHFLNFDHADREAVAVPRGVIAANAQVDASGPESNPLTAELLLREQQRHDSRRAGLADGMFTVVNQEEMLDALAMLTRSTRSSLIAVDHIALEQWFGNPRLTEYLSLQMDLAQRGAATVERVRFVTDAHMGDACERNLLREFVRRHDAAGARLILCPEEGAKRLETVFFPRMGLLLVDPDERVACLTGRLGDAGYIERSTVYLKRAEPVIEARRDFLRLKDYAEAYGHDEALRQRLAEPDDAPTSHPMVDPGLSAAQPLAEPRDDQ